MVGEKGWVVGKADRLGYVYCFFCFFCIVCVCWHGGLVLLGEGDGGIWQESVLATLKHAGRKVAHDGLGLDGEVAKHLIGAPAAD